MDSQRAFSNDNIAWSYAQQVKLFMLFITVTIPVEMWSYSDAILNAELASSPPLTAVAQSVLYDGLSSSNPGLWAGLSNDDIVSKRQPAGIIAGLGIPTFTELTAMTVCVLRLLTHRSFCCRNEIISWKIDISNQTPHFKPALDWGWPTTVPSFTCGGLISDKKNAG